MVLANFSVIDLNPSIFLAERITPRSAFSAHLSVGQIRPPSHASQTNALWSKGEQSTTLAIITASSLQELAEWNALYMQNFGFVFLICASGRSTESILVLAELKKRYTNRLIFEFEFASQEQIKITEQQQHKLAAPHTQQLRATLQQQLNLPQQ
ncbi:uric acid degradation bifunctional protein TTL-like [Lathyrus oleraceus]|uniref:uric acid degradation bifunctional protein TTL-like n=1 Tax=Pisum sativum TaxID=3888 RepID=UPI0021D30EBF|nr:uric acid degradation bifunctional protein TTL-like [Pisum sativum]